MEQQDLLPTEQKGYDPGSKGCNDQLKMLKAIYENCEWRNRNLSEVGLIIRKHSTAFHILGRKVNRISRSDHCDEVRKHSPLEEADERYHVPKDRTVTSVQFTDCLELNEAGIGVAEDSAATSSEQQQLDKKL
jgi:hypothetical protein